VQAVHQAEREHRDKREPRVEHVRIQPVAQHAQQGEDDPASLHRRDDGLVQLNADHVGEGHFECGAGDQQPDHAERDRVAVGEYADTTHRHQRQRQPEPLRCQHTSCGGGSERDTDAD
jgi:hypothetical protein